MTIEAVEEMRALLSLGPDVEDIDVVDAYVESLLGAAITAPAEEPVSLAQAKEQLGIEADDDTDDTRITRLIKVARGAVEDQTKLILTPREIVETADNFGVGLVVTSWPVRGVTAITYLDASGIEQVLDPSSFRLILGRRPARIYTATPSRWPRTLAQPDAVTIALQAGYATPDDVPDTVKHAMLLLIRHYYDNPSAVITGGSGAAAVEVQLGVKSLIGGKRRRIV